MSNFKGMIAAGTWSIKKIYRAFHAGETCQGDTAGTTPRQIAARMEQAM